MDYEGLYKDLIEIGTRALFYACSKGSTAAIDLTDACAQFRRDLNDRGIISDETARALAAMTATPFVR